MRKTALLFPEFCNFLFDGPNNGRSALKNEETHNSGRQVRYEIKNKFMMATTKL